jgi:hypothetical protein
MIMKKSFVLFSLLIVALVSGCSSSKKAYIVDKKGRLTPKEMRAIIRNARIMLLRSKDFNLTRSELAKLGSIRSKLTPEEYATVMKPTTELKGEKDKQTLISIAKKMSKEDFNLLLKLKRVFTQQDIDLIRTIKPKIYVYYKVPKGGRITITWVLKKKMKIYPKARRKTMQEYKRITAIAEGNFLSDKKQWQIHTINTKPLYFGKK